MSTIYDWFSSSTCSASSGYHNSPRNVNSRIKHRIDEIKVELETIAKEEEEDKQKHLPIFDIKDLDI